MKKIEFTILSIWNCYDKEEVEEQDFGGDYHEEEVLLDGKVIGMFGSQYDDGSGASFHFIDGYCTAMGVDANDTDKVSIKYDNEARLNE